MDLMTSLLSTCINLNLSESKVLPNRNYVINKKIEDILLRNGCKIKIDKNKIIISKTSNLYALVNPDIEINSILSSKNSLQDKLQKIYKIVINYELLPSTGEKLKVFLEKIKNKKLKSLIIKIRNNIKLKQIMYS